MKKRLILSFLMIIISYLSFAQIGINTTTPHPSSMLHVEATDKGFILPRLTKSQINLIPNPATGLMVYNTQDNCLNYFNAAKWVSLCGDTNPAAFVAIETGISSCSSIIISGTYKVGFPTTTAEIITLPIDVTEEGSLNIVVTSGNGYSFSYSTSNISVGHHDVTLSAIGTPANEGADNLTISINGKEQTCKPIIPVDPNIDPKKFTVNCSTTIVKGRYIVNRNVEGEHYIEVSITNTDASNTVPYSLYTTTIDGLSFSANGTLPAGDTRPISLVASGKPTTSGLKSFTIQSNSTVETTACLVTVEIQEVVRKIKVLGIGGGVYQPGTAGATNSSRAILQSLANFGTDGTVLTEGIEIINGAYAQGSALTTFINNNNIDIIVMGYNYIPNAETISNLNQFVKNQNGVLIASQENDVPATQNLINAITGGSVFAATTGSVHYNPIGNFSDPVLDGPFGDLKGKALGADVVTSYYFTNLPANVTSLAYQNGTPSRSFAFKHNSLGFVMFGDAGWIAGDASSTALDIWPAKHTGGIPVSKAYIGGTTVYNSILYANIMAWAIDYIKVNKP